VQGKLEALGFWQQEKGYCSTCRAAAPGIFSAPGSGENKTCQDSSGPA